MRILAIMLGLVVILSRGPSSPNFPPALSLNQEQEAMEIWHLTLPEAVRIGLNNSDPVRFISTGATMIPLGGFEPVAAEPGDE